MVYMTYIDCRQKINRLIIGTDTLEIHVFLKGLGVVFVVAHALRVASVPLEFTQVVA